jgi:predicted dehydrogenase
MSLSRRKFIQHTGALTTGTVLLPSLAITACQGSGKAGHVRMGYVGPEAHFRYYKAAFQRLKRASVEMISLENVLEREHHAVFLDSHPTTKSAEILLLLEKNKDIITPYPLAADLYSYNRIQEYMELSRRKIGLLNPLYFYPGVLTLKEWLASEPGKISEIRISCHPEELVRGYHVFGDTGAVQPLQRMITFITDQFPVSLKVEKASDDFHRWIMEYGTFNAVIQTDPGQTGWIMEVEGFEIEALTDHTGMLKLTDDVKPRISATPSAWNKSIIRNIDNFLEAVRSRTEPTVNSLDGLAAIILNKATRESIHSGKKVSL